MRRAMMITMCLVAFLTGVCVAVPVLKPFTCGGTATCGGGLLPAGYVPGPPDIPVSDCMSSGGSWTFCISSPNVGCKGNGGVYSPCTGWSASLGATCVEDHYKCLTVYNW